MQSGLGRDQWMASRVEIGEAISASGKYPLLPGSLKRQQHPMSLTGSKVALRKAWNACWMALAFASSELVVSLQLVGRAKPTKRSSGQRLPPTSSGSFIALICSPNLDRRRLEFRGSDHGGGLAAPPGICRSIGTLYPIALWGLTSL